jgi:hypothetical protein
MLSGAVSSLGLSAARGGGAAAYQIPRSLRFRISGSTSLNRTVSVVSNRKAFTVSVNMKITTVTSMAFVSSYYDDNNRDIFYFNASGQLCFQSIAAGAATAQLTSTRLFRDGTAFANFVLATDTTQAVAADRIKAWVDNVPVTFTGTSPPLNNSFFINYSGTLGIGRVVYSTPQSYFDGFMADYRFIDGQALDPTNFGAYDPVTNVWGPKKYTGTYGVNGFYLDFFDNSSLANLCLDRSGNGNNFTPSNISITAGVTYDSFTDTPTSYGIDTGLGGEVRGNYCTFNSVDICVPATVQLIYGGLMLYAGYANVGAWGTARGTIWVNSGKWYWEMICSFLEAGTGGAMFGILGPSAMLSGNGNTYLGAWIDGYAYMFNALKYNNGVSAAYGSAWVQGDIIGVALDLVAGTLTFYKNNVSQGVAYSGLTGYFAPAASCYYTSNVTHVTANFGQRPFTYAAPVGFKTLCAPNLPDPVIKKPSQYANPVLYNGNHAVNAITGVGHQPDLVWMKSRALGYSNYWVDSVRGVSKTIHSDQAVAENTNAATINFTSFDPDGFTLGASSSTDGVNGAGDQLVAWCWKKGALPGVDIVSIPSASNAAIPHSLGVKPAMIIVKGRGAQNWGLTHQRVTTMNDYYYNLNSTGGVVSQPGVWGGEPTATQFYVGNSLYPNGTSVIAYLFAEVSGFSNFGRYNGNGSADGPFVWCGFRPRWIMIKRSDAGSDWKIIDAVRPGYNVTPVTLSANTAEAQIQNGYADMDLVANGFKIRNTVYNVSGGVYIFAAFAEQPLKYARAR